MLLLLLTPLHASTVLKVGLDELTSQSEFVFEGLVLSKQVRRSNVDGRPCTYFLFSVTDVIRGGYDQPTIELCFSGGTVMIDGEWLTMAVSDMTMPTLGEEGVYFVDRLDAELTHPLVGWNQGHYLVQTGNDQIKRVAPAFPELSAPGDGVVQKAQNLESPLTLDAFKQMIKDRQ